MIYNILARIIDAPKISVYVFLLFEVQGTPIHRFYIAKQQRKIGYY